MSSANEVKATLFEILREAVTGAKKTQKIATDAIAAGAREVARSLIEYNPLKLATGDVALVRTDEYKNHHFTVDAINVTARTISGERHLLADYLLVDRAGEETWLMLRIVPKERDAVSTDGAHLFLLTPQFEVEYDKKTHAALKKGILPVDTGGLAYARPYGVHSAYTGTVTEHTARDGKKESAIEYWDFLATTDDGKELLYIVEMDTETGWFQTYAGPRITVKDVEFLKTST